MAPRKTVRHPLVKNGNKPTDRHTMISCGKVEKEILKYLIKIGDDRCNVTEFTKINGYSNRQKFYDSVKLLIQKGLVSKPNGQYGGNHVITAKGKHWLESVGVHRTVCRDAPDVSYVRDHKFTFQIPVKSFPKGWGATVGILDKHGIQTKLHNFSKNNPLLHTKFPDGIDVGFTTTKIILKPKDIFERDHSSAAFQAIARAQETLFFLIDLGFDFVNDKGALPLIQTEGHYAEVNTILAQFFEKTLRGFSVKGSDNKILFWIDHSNGHLEDETATEEARERLNKQMRSIMENDLPSIAEMSEDLKDLKSITSDLVKMQYLSMQPPTKNFTDDKKGADYFG